MFLFAANLLCYLLTYHIFMRKNVPLLTQQLIVTQTVRGVLEILFLTPL